jgi:hypothetical protein
MAVMLRWRTLVVVALLGLWIALTVAWGWRAFVLFGFSLGTAGVLVVGATLGGGILSRSGSRYYEHLLDGRRRR